MTGYRTLVTGAVLWLLGWGTAQAGISMTAGTAASFACADGSIKTSSSLCGQIVDVNKFPTNFPSILPNYSSSSSLSHYLHWTPKRACPGGCFHLPNGMTQKEFQKYFEKQNNCIFKNQGCKPAKDRIDNNYWERNELIDGNWKIIDVPCNFTTSPQGTCESSSACYSGITLSAGVDMGQHNAQSLKNWDVTPQAHPNLYNILEPLLNTGQACEAENNLQRIHPHIRTDESQKLISLVFPVYLKRLAYQFQQITGDDFYELPADTQTALFDYFYNQGNIYNLVTMSNGQINWDHAMDVLDTDGGGHPHSRFTKDYHKIQNDFVNESLKEYGVCQKRKV